jgi:hypothetical protein
MFHGFVGRPGIAPVFKLAIRTFLIPSFGGTLKPYQLIRDL